MTAPTPGDKVSQAPESSWEKMGMARIARSGTTTRTAGGQLGDPYKGQRWREDARVALQGSKRHGQGTDPRW